MPQIKSQATVYAGPGDTGFYPIRNTLEAGHEVVVLFQQNTFYYVTYRTSAANYKGGYVRTSAVEDVPATVEVLDMEPEDRVLDTAGYAYYGPSDTYLPISYLKFGTAVSFLGIRDAGYALVKYLCPNTNEYQVGYFAEDAVCADLMHKYTDFKYHEKDDAGNLIYADVCIPNPYSMSGYQVTQGFNDTSTEAKGHLGYDLVCNNGSNAVCALFDGVVAAVKSNNTDANGRVICLRHNIRGIEFYTAYCHLAPETNEVPFPAEGDVVSVGNRIATIGGSGGGSETEYAPHVHVCVFTADGPTIDPQGYARRSTANETMEAVSQGNYNELRYCYGPDAARFPSCRGLCFYDPYGVVSTNADVIRLYPETYDEGSVEETPEETPAYHPCDVNRDGVVDLLDVTRAQRYFGTDDPTCDVDGSGTVDVADLIMIMNNYTE